MKIGILSMKYITNYGGILQSYGLFKFLEAQGHQVVIINYSNSGKNSIGSMLAKLERRFYLSKSSVTPPSQKLSKAYLQNFVDFKAAKLVYTKLVNENDLSSVTDDLDAVIIGSDQIWNDVFTNRLAFYGDWEFKGKKIVYAACTILPKHPFTRKIKVKGLLRKLDVITVRDAHTQNFVQNAISSQCVKVVDPSCLYDYRDCIKDNPIGKPYILTYILSTEIAGGNMAAIKLIKDYVGDITVVSVCIPSLSIAAKNISDILLTEASPEEWVNLFFHASFIYTDSFHGIMFSLKFCKPFIAYTKEGQRKSRLHDIMGTYHLHNVVSDIEGVKETLSNGVIDYEVIEPHLQKDVEMSKQILIESLNV